MLTSRDLDVVRQDGYGITPNVIDSERLNQILKELERVGVDEAVSQRAGTAFGIRNLLNIMPAARELANSVSLRSLIEPVLGPQAKVVRGICFDKHKDANWKVIWHQDLTIAVRRKTDAEGYGPWSVKAGIAHVQPPVSVLERMLAIRLHLDDTDESNGALRVIPGSHRRGRLDAENIQSLTSDRTFTTCPVSKGGVMLMRPLLLHSSSPALIPRHRRVLHFEYSSTGLPGGVEWYECQGM